jgi:hypothetical protein
VVVIASGFATVRTKTPLTRLKLSETRMANSNVPAAVGVPLSKPEEDKFRPAGNGLPADQVRDVPVPPEEVN